MNPRAYHTPPHPVSTRVRCPVCHKDVYSRAGIHPQCAVLQSDPRRLKSKPGAVVEAVPAAEASMIGPPFAEFVPAPDGDFLALEIVPPIE